ncbi:uncharacterized protein LOC119264150 [Pygocentrus nattereri]|uniref:uncharacterized protein LOC119264150 n=1 Tax=Pygocentrus nattereri TaxID=42514 RepID=UPI001891DF4B|nr:uncharacterized protein LOC119264150 [Pygocentrus nattereri]
MIKMAKRFTVQSALQLILEETEGSHSDAEEVVSEYEDHISENSESDSEFEEKDQHQSAPKHKRASGPTHQHPGLCEQPAIGPACQPAPKCKQTTGPAHEKLATFRQYIPSKPAKYGIKIWAACDAASSYVWNLQVYTGKCNGGAPEKNQVMRVVLNMAQGLSGHNITCQNFFTSHQLGQDLLKRKLTMVGTVRKGRSELPPQLTENRGQA